MRIYTRTGDQGQTSLASGKRVPKYHERLEAYGTVDELNSVTGLVRSLVVDKQLLVMLHKIQNMIFTISSDLAMDDDVMKKDLPKIDSSDILELEKDMDRMMDLLPPLKNFILPGGNQAVATCHVARTVCRRAERLLVHLNESIMIDDNHLKYINRLSDYFFVAARKTAMDMGAAEDTWHADYKKRNLS